MSTRKGSPVLYGGILALILVLLYGSLLLWAGYSIGSGQTQPPALLLQMPVGIIVGALCFCCGIFWGVKAAKDFSEGSAAWRKRLFMALGCMLSGGGCSVLRCSDFVRKN